MIKLLQNWIISHDHVKEYFCSNNCIKIEFDGGDEKFIVAKLYLQVPIKYLYGDIIKPPNLCVLDEAL